MAELEDSLLEQRDANKSLKTQLDDTRNREMEEAELSSQLHHAEDQIEQLRKDMRDQDKRSQVSDRDSLSSLKSLKSLDFILAP